MSKAERVDKLHAICMVCGDEASSTQRLVNGKPARYDDPVVIVGAAEMYEARCRIHHEVPRDRMVGVIWGKTVHGVGQGHEKFTGPVRISHGKIG